MSPLPQRKKSPEELAELRESLGIPGASANEESTAPAEPQPAAGSQPAPTPNRAPKPVRSLKKSERNDTPPAKKTAPADHPETPADEPVHAPKPVRSLRKSEQIPVVTTPHAPPPDSKLPSHRHNDQELEEIRRHQVLTGPQTAENPKLAVAHPALIIPGYLLAVAAAICPFYDQISIWIPAGCAILALLIASFIFLRKPLSRHHAGFIIVITLFVIVFSALHYFPQLRHAT